MTEVPLLPPDPRPGVAVAIFYQSSTGRVSLLPRAILAVNDRVSLPPELRTRQCETHEYWPMTASGLLLYGLWRDYGLRALCVPLNP